MNLEIWLRIALVGQGTVVALFVAWLIVRFRRHRREMEERLRSYARPRVEHANCRCMNEPLVPVIYKTDSEAAYASWNLGRIYAKLLASENQDLHLKLIEEADPRMGRLMRHLLSGGRLDFRQEEEARG